METKDFVILSLGPVQGFISTARRTQDLAASSLLLSRLSEQALAIVEVLPAVQIIYPQKISSTWSESLPNRIVLLTTQGNGRQLGLDLECHLRKQWIDQVGGRIQTFFKNASVTAGLWDVEAQSQFAQFLEIYWLASPWDGDPATYGAAYRQASLGFDTRKNIRPYPTQPQAGWKCSLCGIHSALGKDQARSVWAKIRQHFGPVILRAGERLCAICSAKRFGQLAGVPALGGIAGFPSTSSVAMAAFRQAVLNHWDECQPAVQEFLSTLFNFQLVNSSSVTPGKSGFARLDGDYLFDDFYRNPRRMEELRQSALSADEQRQVIGQLNRFIKVAKEKAAAPAPSAYYAILMLDGDHMGPLLDSIHSPVEHQNISLALSQVAVAMRTVIENTYHGRMVFCGGDDALALLPVEQALMAANHLRSLFSSALEQVQHQGCTASVGLVIVHHQFPLSKALEQVRQVESDAKNLYDRNALVVRILRRSGEPRQAGIKWDDQAIHALERVRSLIACEVISNKFAYEFQDEALTLPLTSGLSARRLELKRLLKRHSSLDETSLDQLAGEIEGIAARLVDLSPNETYNEQLGQWLVMTRFLAQEAVA